MIARPLIQQMQRRSPLLERYICCVSLKLGADHTQLPPVPAGYHSVMPTRTPTSTKP